MKFLHIADLHIGKIVNEFSMLIDQKYILEQIIQIASEEQVTGVFIAGDIYDRSIPPADAVTMLDWFLSTLIQKKIKVFMVSGNHDSAERIGFAHRILDENGLYIAGEYKGTIKSISLMEGSQRLNVHLLPFVKPQTVKYYEEHKAEQDKIVNIKTIEEGVITALSHLELNDSECNILVTHHFVTSGTIRPEQSDSEIELSLGGIDDVDVSVFDGFDYVALGHIHRPQRIGRDTIRYAGSPLKYSFSEANQKKSVTIVDIHDTHEIQLSVRKLQPLHDMRKIKGSLKELMKEEVYALADTKDYIQATLTDTEELLDPIGTLRSVYPNIMQIILDKNQKEVEYKEQRYEERKSKSAMELFQEFYEQVTGREFDENKREVMSTIMEELPRS